MYIYIYTITYLAVGCSSSSTRQGVPRRKPHLTQCDKYVIFAVVFQVSGRGPGQENGKVSCSEPVICSDYPYTSYDFFHDVPFFFQKSRPTTALFRISASLTRARYQVALGCETMVLAFVTQFREKSLETQEALVGPGTVLEHHSTHFPYP